MKTTITVRSEELIGKITPYMTGACIEDVNHEVYGGLYSQMIFGESFEEEPMRIESALNAEFKGLSGTVSCRAERTYLASESQIRSWQPFRHGSAEGLFNHTALRSCRGGYSQMIRFLAGDGEVGIENLGLNRWGMNFVEGKPYEGVVVLLAEDTVEVSLALESRDGSQRYAETTVPVKTTNAWAPVEFTLTPGKSDNAGRFAIKLKQPGAVWVDYAFLQPGEWGRFKGLAVRRDIAECLVSQGLTVLRDGGSMINTCGNDARCPGSGYYWKKMIGPRRERPPYMGTYYRYNSNGFGIIEFIAFCEAAGFLAIPAVNSDERPEDIEHLIEYLNGPADTEWGQRRVEDGRPAPFGVKYIQIGNEECGHDYPERFKALSDAIMRKDQGITSIISFWLYFDKELQHAKNRERTARLLEYAKGKKVLWDVHIGGDELRDADTTEVFFRKLRQYIDQVDPGNKIRFCVLEENGGRHDLQRALGHAHNINTLERIGDEVLIDCPANCLQPWQQNDNSWDQGQVFFTPSQVWGMPPYYAQRMIAHNYQPLCIKAQTEGAVDSLDVTATRSENGNTFVVKVVNLDEQDIPVVIDLGKAGAGKMRVHISCLSGDLNTANTPEEPRKIVPAEHTAEHGGGPFEHVFAGHAFTVLRFE